MFEHEPLRVICSDTGEKSLFKGNGGSLPPGNLWNTQRRPFQV